jgi:DHA2 family multidrug resistance protein-like MFS transporter
MSVSNPRRAGRREWIGLAVIALPCLLYAMDLTVLNLAIPSLSADLQPSATELLWIVDIYGFSVAGFLITMGTLGDRIGRRKLLLYGAAAFGIASTLAAFSTSSLMLIVMRAVLGVAGATLAPSTLSLIRNMFHDPRERGIAIGVWITSYSAGGAIGPVIGGVLLQYYWWGSVFLIGVPVMVLLLAVGPILLPEYRDPKAGRIDLPSAALSLVAVLAFIYGVKQLTVNGLAWMPVVSIAVGVILAAVFFRRQSRLADPLVDLALFRAPAFRAALSVYTVGTLIAFGTFIFIGQHMQLVLGLAPLQAGLWTLPFAAGFITGSMLTPHLARRVRPGVLMACGLVIAGLGFLLLARVDATSGVGTIVAAFVVYSLGLAPVFTLANEIVVSSAPPERAGAAAALSETGSELGGALGIAILGSLGTAIYRSKLVAMAPQGVPSDVMDTARDTLGAAIASAHQLSAELAQALIDAARTAFVAGMQVSAVLAAVIAFAAAGVAVFALGRAAPASAAT